jgi:hypothetical protein
MRNVSIPMLLILAVMFSGCDKSASEIAYERQARYEAIQRETAARKTAEREQSRREFWQTAAYTASALAVLLLVVGAAAGSRCKDAASKP